MFGRKICNEEEAYKKGWNDCIDKFKLISLTSITDSRKLKKAKKEWDSISAALKI
jgi:hypothetical protein